MDAWTLNGLHRVRRHMLQAARRHAFSRRSLLTGIAVAGAGLGIESVSAQSEERNVFLPIGWPGSPPGQGFWIRHGFATENTWYNPGWWHCGEDWYALDDAETAGAIVLAARGGEVVFVGSDYPGRVVIVHQHDGLYGMYAHLDPSVEVAEGDTVVAGQSLGTVLKRIDGRAPSHLHYEIRDFLFNDAVNGSSPQHGVQCGLNCPPGPGYWPMSADHPAMMGWRNPTLAYADQIWSGEVIVAEGAPLVIEVRTDPEIQRATDSSSTIELEPGFSLHLSEILHGDAASIETSASAYQVWGTGPELEGWIRIVGPDSAETGSDGRPSAVTINFLTIPS